MHARAERAIVADGFPGIGGGVIAPAIVEPLGPVAAAPNDHLLPGPDGSMPAALGGSAFPDDGSPGIGEGIVVSARVELGIRMPAGVAAVRHPRSEQRRL